MLSESRPLPPCIGARDRVPLSRLLAVPCYRRLNISRACAAIVASIVTYVHEPTKSACATSCLLARKWPWNISLPSRARS
eukprot:COSAG01_NODE_7721_length_3084_cov_53.575544_2_plen_80_part_00